MHAFRQSSFEDDHSSAGPHLGEVYGRYGSPELTDDDSTLFAEFSRDEPLALDCGETLAPWRIAYRTYGTLNREKSNAILICHALTGDQHCADRHPTLDRPGWWHHMVGDGKPFDTSRYFVVCPNVLGSCMGTTGPASGRPDGLGRYGLGFPLITIPDMVRAQKMLIDRLGIESLFCVAGGSMGGMQVLEWASQYPQSVFSAIPVSTSWRHSAQNIAFHEVGRQAVMADPEWSDGDYVSRRKLPTKGLAVARMAAHITYLSEAGLHRKFGRSLQEGCDVSYGFGKDFQVESYLNHQGSKFVDRFDANSYLYLTRAMDYFDLAKRHGGVLSEAFRDSSVRLCVISFSSDWLFPTAESRELVRAVNAAGADASFAEIESDKGHDGFLLDEPEFRDTVSGFLESSARRRGLVGSAKVASSSSARVVSRGSHERMDFLRIAEMVGEGSRVLDVGCAHGDLLELLISERGVRGSGMELSREGVNRCVAKGLSVVQGDAEGDLDDYPDDAFDYVILSRTIHAMRRPKDVLRNALRIGTRAICSVPNYASWKVARSLLLRGCMPSQGKLSDPWCEGDAARFCTLKDFEDMVAEVAQVERRIALNSSGREVGERFARRRASEALFLLRRGG